MTDRLKQVRNYFSEGFLSYVSFLKFLNNALYEKNESKKKFFRNLEKSLITDKTTFWRFFPQTI